MPPPPRSSTFGTPMLERFLAGRARPPARAQPPPARAQPPPARAQPPPPRAQPPPSTEDLDIFTANVQENSDLLSREDHKGVKAIARKNVDLLRNKYFENQNNFGFSHSHYLRVFDHWNNQFYIPFHEAFNGSLVGSALDKYLIQLNADMEKALAKLEETSSDYKRLESVLVKRVKATMLALTNTIVKHTGQPVTDQDRQDVLAIITDIMATTDGSITRFLDLFLDSNVDKSRYDLLFEKIQTDLDAIDVQIAESSFFSPPFASPRSVEQLNDDEAVTSASNISITQAINNAVAVTHRLSSREPASSHRLSFREPAPSQRPVTQLIEDNVPAASQELSRPAATSRKSHVSWVGGFKRYSLKIPSYKYYLKAVKSYSKRKLKTFRKRRNYKKTKRNKY